MKKAKDALQWKAGRPPATPGLYLVELTTGDLVAANVEKAFAVSDDHEYFAFVSDGCSCPLDGDDCDVRFVVAHLGPLPAPPAGD